MQLDLLEPERDRFGWCHHCGGCGQYVKDPKPRVCDREDRREWHLVCWVRAGRGDAAQVAMVEREGLK